MGRQEAKVEKYLGEQIKKLGGFNRKWISPGNAGTPDQIIFLPGFVGFVEVKTDKGVLSKLQDRELALFRKFGFFAGCAYGKGGVDLMIQGVINEYNFRIQQARKAKRRTEQAEETSRIIIPGRTITP